MNDEQMEENDHDSEVSFSGITHAYFGKHRNGKFVRTSETAICGAVEQNRSDHLGEIPPANLCPICQALYEYRDLAGI